MKLILFAIRDTKAENYGPPFGKYARGEAERDFVQMTNDKNTKVHAFPEDFDLYEVGAMDQETGKITGLDTPVHMMKAINVIRPKE